jgi:hypothetical protein
MIKAGITLAAAALFSLFLPTNVKAQKPKLGIGVHAGLPTTDDYFNIAIGADVRVQFDVARQLSIPFTTGFTAFVPRPRDAVFMLPDGSFSSSDNLDYGYIPVKAGLKYFFDKSGSGLYGLAEVGAAIGVTRRSKVAFLYAPALGYSWSSGIDLGLKYEAISRGLKFTDDTIGEIAIRVAYGFKL